MMEILLECLLEIIFEGTVELSKSHKVPRFIRCFLIALIISFSLSIIGLIFFTGILLYRQNVLGGLLMMILGTFMAVASIVQFRKQYLLRR